MIKQYITHIILQLIFDSLSISHNLIDNNNKLLIIQMLYNMHADLVAMATTSSLSSLLMMALSIVLTASMINSSHTKPHPLTTKKTLNSSYRKTDLF